MLALIAFLGCQTSRLPEAPDERPKTVLARTMPPPRCAVPAAPDLWTDLLADIAAADVALADRVPDDIASFCPNYQALPPPSRRRFWVLLLSAMAHEESRCDPTVAFQESFRDAQGDLVVSRGLLQLSIESANGYGCGFGAPEELHDPARNLRCGVRIMVRWLDRDRVIGARSRRTWLGGARYWSTLRETTPALNRIRSWTLRLEMCSDDSPA